MQYGIKSRPFVVFDTNKFITLINHLLTYLLTLWTLNSSSMTVMFVVLKAEDDEDEDEDKDDAKKTAADCGTLAYPSLILFVVMVIYVFELCCGDFY